jgi:argininosuccinate synthase
MLISKVLYSTVEVRALRDQFITFNYSKILYNGLSPEREFLEDAIAAS